MSFLQQPADFISFAENSFDPSHANFLHEGLGFGSDRYSPESAVPMVDYKVYIEDDAPHNSLMMRNLLSPFLVSLFLGRPPSAAPSTSVLGLDSFSASSGSSRECWVYWRLSVSS